MEDARYGSELARLAAEAVDPMRVAELAQALVQIRSVYDEERGTSEAKAAAFIAAELESLGLEPILEEVAPGRPNVICDWAGARFDPLKHRTLMFEGHTDVVTEGDPGAWRVPPFQGRIEGDVLHGRGSADMKAGVAASIAALEAIMRVAPNLTGRVRLGFMVDEEGLMLGIKEFIARGHADDVSGAIVAEPEENEICLFQKGAMRVNVLVRGVMSHGAMPYAGVNPMRGVADLITRLRELERREQERLGEHDYLGWPWITPTVARAPMSGEAQLNVMPGEAYLALDIRTVPGQDHARLEEQLNEIACELESATRGLIVDIDVFESRPWTETAADDPLVRACERVYPAVFGTAPRYGGVPGATDGTFLWAKKGIPIVTIGPGDRTIPHQVNEFVRLSDAVLSARLYAAAAVTYLQTDDE